MKCPHCDRNILSPDAMDTLAYMKKEAPRRGGYMYEGARPAYESGAYKDSVLDELLSFGAIKPHDDPKKGWVIGDGW